MKPNIIPILQYHNAPDAIEFLVRALGFTKQRLQTTPAGGIVRGELRLGAGAIRRLLGFGRDRRVERRPPALPASG